MFFYIGDDCQYLDQVHDRLHLDNGWTQVLYQNNLVWFKGYSTECRINECLDKIIIHDYRPRGKWVVIVYDTDYKLFFPKNRGTPLYQLNNNISNIKVDDFNYVNEKLEFQHLSLHYEDVVDKITNILSENIINYYNLYDNKLNVWFTGGIDSLSIISILENIKIPYQIYVGEKIPYTGNVREFEKSITEYESPLIKKCQKDYWGYEILSFFNKKITLLTGFYGDEYVLRGPHQLNNFAGLYNKTILDFAEPDHYMYYYLQRTNKKQKFTIQQFESEEYLKKLMKFDISGDHQIWHIDYITTMCPYFDERIIDCVLSLPAKDLINKSLNVDIQKDVIKKCKPELLFWLDSFKNTSYSRNNFFLHKDKVSLSYCTKIEVVC